MDDKELDDLKWHWGEAYVIGHPGPDLWVAQRRDNRGTIWTSNAEELLEFIRADYVTRPVPRSGRTVTGGRS